MSALISKSAFAKLCGVSAPAISDAVKRGIVVPTESGSIDLDEPNTKAYLARRKAVSTGETPNPDRFHQRQETPIAPQGSKTRSEVELEILEQKAFALRMKNAIQVGEVVSRASFEKGIWQPIEGMCIHWLTDVPKSLAAQIRPAALSGATVQEIEDIIRKALSQEIKSMKKKCETAVQRMSQERLSDSSASIHSSSA
jgi:phage terminase Nu1 subunit (DNA packaging protein)